MSGLNEWMIRMQGPASSTVRKGTEIRVGRGFTPAANAKRTLRRGRRPRRPAPNKIQRYGAGDSLVQTSPDLQPKFCAVVGAHLCVRPQAFAERPYEFWFFFRVLIEH